MAKGSGTKTDRLTSAARKQRGSHWTGQDTVLALLFDALQPTNRYFVEFGFNTNSYAPGQNTEKIWHAGWRGLLLDGGHANASINLQQEFIKSTNIVELFRKHGVPLEPDYVSVDMDSADLWVVDAMLGTYKPRVYSVEYNPNYPWRFAYDLPGRGAVGPRVQARPRTLWTQRRGQAVKSRLLRRRLGTSNGPRRKEARLHSCGGRQAVGHVLRAGRCVMALATRPCASLELVDDVNVSFSPSGNEVKNAFAKGWAVNMHPDYKQMTAEQAVTMIDLRLRGVPQAARHPRPAAHRCRRGGQTRRAARVVRAGLLETRELALPACLLCKTEGQSLRCWARRHAQVDDISR